MLVANDINLYSFNNGSNQMQQMFGWFYDDNTSAALVGIGTQKNPTGVTHAPRFTVAGSAWINCDLKTNSVDEGFPDLYVNGRVGIGSIGTGVGSYPGGQSELFVEGSANITESIRTKNATVTTGLNVLGTISGTPATQGQPAVPLEISGGATVDGFSGSEKTAST